MNTWRRGHRRALPWQRNPTFGQLHDLSVFADDTTMYQAGVKKASVRPLTSGRGCAYMTRDVKANTDDRHDYFAARRGSDMWAWAQMMREPWDAAARRLQPVVRGRRVRSRVALLRRARARWLHKRVAAAFNTWEAWSRSVSIRAFALRRVLARLEHVDLAKGWHQWTEVVAECRRREGVKRRVLARLARGKWLAAAWRSWALAVRSGRARDSAVRGVLQKATHRTLAAAWRKWRADAEGHRRARLEACLRRVAARLFDKRSRLCGLAWRAWRLAVLDEKRGTALLKLETLGAAYLLKWAAAKLRRAWNTWKKDRRRPVVQGRGSLRLLHYDRAARPRADPRLNDRVASLEGLLKQLQCMRLEEQLGEARAASRASGWITALPLNHALPAPPYPRLHAGNDRRRPGAPTMGPTLR